MRFDLATLARRQRNIRRSRIVLREIAAPATFGSNLYARCYRPVVALWQRRADRIITGYATSLLSFQDSPMHKDEAGYSLFPPQFPPSESDDQNSLPGSDSRPMIRDEVSRSIPYGSACLTTDSPADIQREIDEGQSEFQRLFMELEPELRDWLIRVESWQRGRWRGAVLSATGVDLQTLIGPQDMRDTIEAYLRWNTALIRDVSDQTRKRIADRVFAGLTQRKPARDVAREVREAVGMARDRSQRIAADQLSKISNSLADERRREAGIDTWVWMHSRKRHPRADHQARDGREYTDATAPQDTPGQLPYCGCRSRAVVRFD